MNLPDYTENCCRFSMSAKTPGQAKIIMKWLEQPETVEAFIVKGLVIRPIKPVLHKMFHFWVVAKGVIDGRTQDTN